MVLKKEFQLYRNYYLALDCIGFKIGMIILAQPIIQNQNIVGYSPSFKYYKNNIFNQSPKVQKLIEGIFNLEDCYNYMTKEWFYKVMQANETELKVRLQLSVGE